jgi:hypothetical protein
MSSAHMTDVIRCVSTCGNYILKVKVWRRLNADLLQNGIKVILPNEVKDDGPRCLPEQLRIASNERDDSKDLMLRRTVAKNFLHYFGLLIV